MSSFDNPSNDTPNDRRASKLTNQLLLPQLVTASIEIIINKALSLNNAPLNVNAVAQKTLVLDLAELSFLLCFTVNSGAAKAVILVRSEAESSDCTINTSIHTLKKLKDNESLTLLIKQDELDVVGDLKIAQQFANIAQSLNIDWQSELAKHIGDVPTHKLLSLGKKASKSILSKSKQIESDITDYLVHEKRLVVTSSQINIFNQQVSDVAKQTDSIAERIDKLASHLKQL